MKYKFKSKRLGFRKWKEEDLEPFFKMNADKEVMEFYPKTLTRFESDEFVTKINRMFKDFDYGLYAVDELETKEFIGYVGFWNVTFESEFTPFIEIGWKIKKEKWGQGFATEGAKECLKFGFNNLKLTEIYSLTSKLNLKSERIMQKIKMEKVAEFEHPEIQEGNPLKTHILYKIESKNTAHNTGSCGTTQKF